MEKNDSDSDRVCPWCGTPLRLQTTLARCARCKTAYYCTAVCASGHWGHGHYKECVPATTTAGLLLKGKK